jgi:putative DNA primase/helicase
VIDETGHAIWRRVQLIPFGVTIPEAQQDRHLPEKLRQERHGILRRLVDACRECASVGLNPPDLATAATRAYRQDMDQIQLFMQDVCEKVQGESVASKQLFDAYRQWTREQGFTPYSSKQFPRRLEEHGYEKRRNSSGQRWTNLRLRVGLSEEAPDSAAKEVA